MSNSITDREDSRLLSGVKVLDLGRLLAAPHPARLMADLGAEVIKVERPQTGDDTRLDPYIYEDALSGAFMQQNWGKASLSLNTRHELAPQVLERLIVWADVLVENFRPGTMDRMGFGYERARELNPKIIMCSVSAYGQDGPYADRVGYGPIAEAVAGIPSVTGESDGPPMPTLVPIADNMAAGQALATICAALYHREVTGQGEYIDIALLDSAFQMHDMAVQQYLASDGKIEMSRRGLQDVTWVPWGFFDCQGEWICIMAGNESTWKSLCEAMGREDLRDNPDYSSYENRAERQDEIYGLVEAWVSSFPDADAVVAVLGEASVPADRVNDIGGAIDNEQLKSRNMLKEFEHPELGPVKVMNSGIKLRNTSADVHGLPPDLGEHTRQVLSDVAGFSEAEIAGFFDEGVVFEHDRVARRAAAKVSGAAERANGPAKSAPDTES